jgi:peptidoglycan/LPS O-acetylase OafA/YrhL
MHTEFPVSHLRNDVQGLRGIAILCVVLYHADFYLHGGFVGVDIFFVISGYVITNSLLRELATSQKINVGAFITRRIKRLLPALSFMSICTLVISVFVASPFGEQQQIAKTALSSSLFGANIYLAIQNSYFALINNPFRHTWTLAVEEQFYLFFILMLAVLQYAFAKRSVRFSQHIVVSMSAFGIISFALSTILSNGQHLPLIPIHSATRIAFFSMPTRFWEFAVGVLLALYESKRLSQNAQSIHARITPLIGIFLIAYSLLRFNSFTTFPGLSALVPVTGSALLIMNRGTTDFARRLLSVRPIMWFGNLSYSWYLWHWPLIVFTRILWPGNSLLVLFSSFFSLLPAYFSYRYIENRFRTNSILNKGHISTLKVFLFSTFAPISISLAVILAATSGYGLTRHVGSEVNLSLADKFGCQMEKLPFPTSNCLLEREPGAPLVLLIGDSQAGTLSDPIAAATKSLNLNFAMWYNNGCPIFPRPTLERPDCNDYLLDLPELIEKLNPKIVVIANASTLYTTSGPLIGGLTITKANGEIPSNYEEAIQTWTDGFERNLENPTFIDRKVVIISQVPPARFLSPSILRPNVSTESFDLESLSDRNLLIAQEKAAMETQPTAAVFDTADFLCPNGKCQFSIGGADMYYDPLHLTVRGAMLLVPGLTTTFRQLIK